MSPRVLHIGESIIDVTHAVKRLLALLDRLQGARVHADERSNALLVYAPNGQRDAVLELVAKLDVEVR